MKQCNFLSGIIALCIISILSAQSQFSPNDYARFLAENKNITTQTLLDRHDTGHDYYKGMNDPVELTGIAFADSVLLKYQLTRDEQHLIAQNQFMVTERLSYSCFGQALHDIYGKDLPLFFTTDMVLHALHVSYDQLLADIEIAILEPELKTLLDQMTRTYPDLVSKYENHAALDTALTDVDIYLTLSKSLLKGQLLSPQKADPDVCRALWVAVAAEQMTSMPLFSERPRRLDFSQFTVRGHYNKQYWHPYTHEEVSLKDYFKCMMWLGRMDFYFTPPPPNPYEAPWTKEEIRRMNLGGLLLNELADLAGARASLEKIDHIITLLVGESDNLTPGELNTLLDALSIDSAADLLDNTLYDAYQNKLKSWTQAGQQILSAFMMIDPSSATPDTLPVSFRLCGQRYIIDSYVLGQVVMPNIIYQGKKEWRLMPDPLDALFTLGNDNALELLKQEIDTYHYGSRLAALRYLVESHDPEFWDASLYNAWLQSLRCLNPEENRKGLPFFMKTAAWRQQKINTQLASWAQLRHDNLLYAKQSYTGGTACSFPHTYVEPYPAFYKQIARFAQNARQYLGSFSFDDTFKAQILDYFARLDSINTRLASLAQKEIDGMTFTENETDWLKDMLFTGGMSGEPPFTGWFSELFYDPWKAAEMDYVIADVHTQPTDSSGAEVGRILHVGVGQVNLGCFIAPSSSLNNKPMAFVGPVMSYYEKITSGFKRLTDEAWKEEVWQNNVPARPDWTHIYLADASGNAKTPGRELQSTLYTGIDSQKPAPETFMVLKNHPNPFNPLTTITYHLPQSGHVILSIYNLMGQRMTTLVNNEQTAGSHRIQWNGKLASGAQAPTGIYILHLETGAQIMTRKISLLK